MIEHYEARVGNYEAKVRDLDSLDRYIWFMASCGFPPSPGLKHERERMLRGLRGFGAAQNPAE